jgi:hypothetical protein
MKQTSLFEESKSMQEIKMQPVLASFAIERREFIEALRTIKRPVHLSRKDTYTLKFDLFVIENKILFRLYENECWLDIKTNGTCSTSLFYKDVFDALKISKEFWIDVNIKQKTIGLNQVNLTSPTEALDPTVKEIPISVISAPIHPYDHQAVTPDKHFFTQDLKKGFYSETVEKDIKYVRAALKKYDIPKSDIEKFIYSYLKFPKV